MWYEFSQNNSGGSLTEDNNLCHRLFIEARNVAKAKEKAIRLGVYFQGVDDGIDCSCCGDRWSEYVDEIKIPYRYGSFDKKIAEKRAKEYTADFGTTEFRFGGKGEPDPNQYDIVFRNIESYGQYLADYYGLSKGIDGRIFYEDGSRKEIISDGKSRY